MVFDRAAFGGDDEPLPLDHLPQLVGSLGGRAALELIAGDEIKEIHDRIALIFRMAGLKGHPLDQAIATVAVAALEEIDHDRQAKAMRLSSIRLVQPVTENEPGQVI